MIVIPENVEELNSYEPEVFMNTPDKKAAPHLIPPSVRIGKRRAKPFLPLVEKDAAAVDKLVKPMPFMELPLFLHLGPKPNKLPPSPATNDEKESAEDMMNRRFKQYLKMRHDYN